MKLQKASRYALYAVLHLASEPDKQHSTAEIAEEYEISIHHLAKVMRTLVRESGGNLGVYASVETPGQARVGDRVELLD